MKRCPECARDYDDDSMSFCLDDGAELLFGPATADEPATAILSEAPALVGGQPASENPTRPFIHTTASEAEPRESLRGLSEKHSVFANRAAKPLIAAVVGVVILLGGFFGYRYFYFESSTDGQINSIAVLPFENRSGNPDSEYLSDGLAESLIYRLSQLPDLKVSPTSSVFRYKGKETDPQTVAKELGVDSVMTGRITQRGDNLTISVNLVDTRNGKSLWGEQYERKMSELLTTQREIAAEITNKLQLKLSGAGEQKLAKKYTDNNEAYQLYLKGRHSYARRDKDGMFKAIELYKQAIQIDPNFALAYAHLADIYNHIPNFAYISPNESFPLAKAAAQRAIELDPNLSEGYTGLGNALGAYDWNWVESEKNFKKAIELDPNSELARFRYATEYLIPVGRKEEALTEINHALELAPLDINILVAVARAHLASGQVEKALEQARKVNEIDRDYVIGRWMLGRCYLANGLYEEAIALGKESFEKYPNQQVIMQFLGIAYAKSGRRREAEEIIGKYREIEKTAYVSSYLIASIYGALGEKDKGFAELEKAFQKKDSWLKWLKLSTFMFDLRTDPRYEEMLKRMNFPE